MDGDQLDEVIRRLTPVDLVAFLARLVPPPTEASVRWGRTRCSHSGRVHRARRGLRRCQRG